MVAKSVLFSRIPKGPAAATRILVLIKDIASLGIQLHYYYCQILWSNIIDDGQKFKRSNLDRREPPTTKP